MAKKQKVILRPIAFRKKNHIAILSMNNQKLDAIVRGIEDAEWSTGYKFWHVPCKKGKLKSLIAQLKKEFKVDTSAFSNYDFEDIEEEKCASKQKIKVDKPSPEQVKKIEEYKDYYLQQGISRNTIKVYGSLLNVFWGWHNNLEEKQLEQYHINQFISGYIEENNFSPNYKRLMSSTLTRYLQFVEQKELV